MTMRARRLFAVSAGPDGRSESVDVVPGVGPHGRTCRDVDADDNEHGRAAREHYRNTVKVGGSRRFIVTLVEFLRMQQPRGEHR